MQKEEVRSIAVNVSNLVGLFCGANAFFPEAGEPIGEKISDHWQNPKEGFSTALWRQSNEITTNDCRNMFKTAGFSNLINSAGQPIRSLLYGLQP